MFRHISSSPESDSPPDRMNPERRFGLASWIERRLSIGVGCTGRDGSWAFVAGPASPGLWRGARNFGAARADRKSTRLNSSHVRISYAVFCLKKKNQTSAPDAVHAQ